MSSKKILIGVPCMEQIPYQFVNSLLTLAHPAGCSFRFAPCSLVYTARDTLAQEAINGEFDYILMIDSDMTFDSMSLLSLLEDDKDIVGGLYFKRRPPFDPVIYEKIQPRMAMGRQVMQEACADIKYDIEDDLFEVEGMGFGFILIRTQVLKDVFDDNISCFTPMEGLGEDLAFCFRAMKKGYKIWCDPKIKLGHVATTVITKELAEASNADNGQNCTEDKD